MKSMNLRSDPDSKTRLFRSFMPMVIAIAFLFWMTGFASAAPETFMLDPASPVSGEAFYLNITTDGSCIAQVTVANATGHVLWDDIISISGNGTSIGPLLLDEGNYSVNGIFWYVVNGNLTISSSISSFHVTSPVEETEKYSALSVLIVGMSVVFFVLGILATSTLITGRVLPKEAKAATVAGGDNEKDKVAAIAALIRFRGD